MNVDNAGGNYGCKDTVKLLPGVGKIDVAQLRTTGSHR